MKIRIQIKESSLAISVKLSNRSVTLKMLERREIKNVTETGNDFISVVRFIY